MKKTLLGLFGALFVMCAAFSSCSDDTEEVDVYADWENRNMAYMDSIVSVYKNPPQGERWERYLDYKLQNGSGGVSQLWDEKLDYVYVKVLERNFDTPGLTPMYTDTTYVHYRGTLINGEIFDQTYSGEWNEAIGEPASFPAGGPGTRSGWTTAMLHMYEGDHVEIYMPYTMAYGASGYDRIPGYSTLIFNIHLENIVHPKGPDDRSRKPVSDVAAE